MTTTKPAHEPKRSMEEPKPETAYTALIAKGGWVVGLATENEAGYTPTTTYGPFDDEEPARELASRLNDALGVSRSRALLITLSSMFPTTPAQHAKRRARWAADEAAMAARKTKEGGGR